MASRDLLSHQERLLPLRPRPHEGELASSWFARAARGLGITYAEFVLHHGAIDVRTNDVDFDALDGLVPIVQSLGLVSSTLRQCQPLGRHPYLDARQLRPWLRRPLKDACGLLFCPLCLKSDAEPYFRLDWGFAFMFMCVKHRCLLHDRCPNCVRPVGYSRTKVDRGTVQPSIYRCIFCKFDFRRTRARRWRTWNRAARLALRAQEAARECVATGRTAFGTGYPAGEVEDVLSLSSWVIDRLLRLHGASSAQLASPAARAGALGRGSALYLLPPIATMVTMRSLGSVYLGLAASFYRFFLRYRCQPTPWGRERPWLHGLGQYALQRRKQEVDALKCWFRSAAEAGVEVNLSSELRGALRRLRTALPTMSPYARPKNPYRR